MERVHSLSIACEVLGVKCDARSKVRKPPTCEHQFHDREVAKEKAGPIRAIMQRSHNSIEFAALFFWNILTPKDEYDKTLPTYHIESVGLTTLLYQCMAWLMSSIVQVSWPILPFLFSRMSHESINHSWSQKSSKVDEHCTSITRTLTGHHVLRKDYVTIWAHTQSHQNIFPSTYTNTTQAVPQFSNVCVYKCMLYQGM